MEITFKQGIKTVVPVVDRRHSGRSNKLCGAGSRDDFFKIL